MKQIILISRIDHDSSEEFLKYSKDNHLEFIPAIQQNRCTLLIINGSKLRSLKENSQKAASILEMAQLQKLEKELDTILLYHSSSDLTRALKNKFESNHWKVFDIRRYSSSADKDKSLYKVLNPLGAALKQQEPLDDLLKKLCQMTFDAFLEAKLNLLHKIYKGEMPILDTQLSDYQLVYNDLKKQIASKYQNENSIHRKALSDFRDILLEKSAS